MLVSTALCSSADAATSGAEIDSPAGRRRIGCISVSPAATAAPLSTTSSGSSKAPAVAITDATGSIARPITSTVAGSPSWANTTADEIVLACRQRSSTAAGLQSFLHHHVPAESRSSRFSR